MSFIKVNDIFDQLSDENKRLKQCLNILIDFKSFVDFVFNNLKTNLNSNDSQKLEELNKQIKDVFQTNGFNGFLEPKKNKEKKEINKKLAKNVKISSKNVNIIKTIDQHNDRYLIGTEEPIVRKKRQRYVCDFSGCGKTIRTMKLFKKHVRTHGITHYYYTCDFVGCNYSANTRNLFLDHMNKHKGLKPYECSYCKKTFVANEYLKRHKRQECSELFPQPLTCGINGCNKVYLNQNSLEKHKITHFEEKRLKCTECEFKTFQRRSLHFHQMAKHSNKRDFKCEFEGCVQSFVNNNHLKAHLLTHSKEKSFKCPVDGCDKAYGLRATLKIHTMRIHSAPKYRCEWPGCDYSSGLKSSLDLHSYVHKTDGELVCDWPECGKRFKLRKYLINHSRIHTSDKRYACTWPGCQYRCVFGGNLNKHMRVHKKPIQ